MRQAVVGDSVEAAVREGRCLKEPLGCGKKIVLDRHRRTYFADPVYKTEWMATGLCPSCQLRSMTD